MCFPRKRNLKFKLKLLIKLPLTRWLPCKLLIMSISIKALLVAEPPKSNIAVMIMLVLKQNIRKIMRAAKLHHALIKAECHVLCMPHQLP